MTTQGYSAYRRTQIQTSDPKQIVILLYEGAISRLGQAREAIERGDNQTRTASITRVLEIVHFLSNSLDHERGGEISANLARLYDYVRDIVSMGNIETDTAKFDEAASLLATLLEAWRQVCGNPNATPPIVEQAAREASASIAAVS